MVRNAILSIRSTYMSRQRSNTPTFSEGLISCTLRIEDVLRLESPAEMRWLARGGGGELSAFSCLFLGERERQQD